MKLDDTMQGGNGNAARHIRLSADAMMCRQINRIVLLARAKQDAAPGESVQMLGSASSALFVCTNKVPCLPSVVDETGNYTFAFPAGNAAPMLLQGSHSRLALKAAHGTLGELSMHVKTNRQCGNHRTCNYILRACKAARKKLCRNENAGRGYFRKADCLTNPIRGVGL